MEFFDNLIEQKLLTTHTAYLASVVSTNGTTATVQPLTLQKQFGKAASKQAVVSNIPVLRNARYKLYPKTVGGSTVLGYESLAIGDIVLCVVCERDITEAKKGRSAMPAIRHHNISDSVVAGVIA